MLEQVATRSLTGIVVELPLRGCARLLIGLRQDHDLRVSHETMLLDSAVQIHGSWPAPATIPEVLLRAYAKRSTSSDAKAAAVIGELAAKAAAAL